MADTGLLGVLFGAQQQQAEQAEFAHRQTMQNLVSPLNQGLGSLGRGMLGSPFAAMSNNSESNSTPTYKPKIEKVLSFIQTLRNEIDEWLRI